MGAWENFEGAVWRPWGGFAAGIGSGRMGRLQRLLIAQLFLIVPLAACGPGTIPSFRSDNPAARNAAIVNAAEARDTTALPDLVRMLESEEPSTRLLAFEALRRLTGETLGYDCAADEPERRAAVLRWRAFVEGEGGRGG